MTAREALYALLAAAGLVATWWFNIAYLAAGGSWADLPAVLRLAFANPISSSFSADLFVSFATFVVWAVVEARRIGMRAGWAYPLAGLFLGFALVFPLFLFARERHLRRHPQRLSTPR